ncbi:NAD(+)--rifampin ADP-ribosyltransferase [Erythrobacter oryzae]|uniref:NAD(+)--rifampin ADP-ribosyltransferase n=1 Tax=Erythrobacter oryzae TaxID=3019556 RepID=UPI002554D857|nr:NAD(+)--rifampin ADP-ribosyltransferase [Erythrobacter sp. COR-2]
MTNAATVFRQSFLHGTRADLAVGDLLVTGYPSNFQAEKPLSWVYFTATLDTAAWGAELASGDAKARIYLVEPIGDFVDDPNVTDKRFPGNPTMSYRTQHPLRILGEVVGWVGHPEELIQQRLRDLAKMRAEGTNLIID